MSAPLTAAPSPAEAALAERLDDVLALHRERFGRLAAAPQPKVGWLSVSTPEEIVRAAGGLPYRITGEARPYFPRASTMMHRNLCPYVLSSFEEVLEGDHDFAAGAVLVNACDARRRLFDVWRHFEERRFLHMLDLPKVVSEASTAYFVEQLRQLARALEGALGQKVTDERLREGIARHNRVRALLAELQEHRRTGRARLTGAQAIGVVKAAVTGLDEVEPRLQGLIEAIRAAPDVPRPRRFRVLLAGSYFDHASIADLFEANGAELVCEDMSTGVKYFEGQVDEQGEPFEALARYYLGKATCARMTDSERRFEHLWGLVERHEAHAVVYFALKFCDNNLLAYSLVRKQLQARGVPVLLVEAERAVENIEQVKTRVAAFLESQVEHAAIA